MRTVFWITVFTFASCWRMLAGDLLWENLTAHKVDSISVIYLSDSIDFRIPPSADILKNSYTHSFFVRNPWKQEHFYQTLKKLLSSSQPVGDVSAEGAGEFRWCVTFTSSSSLQNFTTDIYISRGHNVARIGRDFYKLDKESAKEFFDQFTKLFDFEAKP